MRRFSTGLAALVWTLGLVGCGTSAYSSSLEVAIEDPAVLFDGQPIHISIFDPQQGDTRDWATSRLTTVASGETAVGSVSSVETRLGGEANRAKEVRAGIYLPDYHEFGWYQLSIAPEDGQQLQISARFIAWDGYAPFAAAVPPLEVFVTAHASGKSWVLKVTIILGSKLAETDLAVAATDAPTLELIAAARAGHLPEVQRLLLKGAQVNGADGDGQTPLIAAAYTDQLETARYLIQSGADVNLKDAAGRSAFLISTSEVGPSSDLIVLMLNAGPRLDGTDTDGNTGLHLAARKGYAGIVLRLVSNGAPVEAKNKRGRTALHEAVASGGCNEAYNETVRTLLRAAADPNLATADGNHPLELARAVGACPQVVALLQGAGAR